MSRKANQIDRAHQAELARSRTQLALLGKAMEEAWQQFDMLTQPKLIDACVLEINALRCRYDHELAHYKAMERS